jgi:hypothetical protein
LETSAGGGIPARQRCCRRGGTIIPDGTGGLGSIRGDEEITAGQSVRRAEFVVNAAKESRLATGLLPGQRTGLS